MTKVESLRNLFKKILNKNIDGTTIVEVLNDFTENYTPSATNYKIVSYESNFTTTEEITTIPINISQFDKNKDFLNVYINKLRATPNVDYTISNDSNSIELTNGLEVNQVVNFSVLQVKVGDDDGVL